MAMSPGKPATAHMGGHSAPQVAGLKKSEHPMDSNPSGFQSKHEKM